MQTIQSQPCRDWTTSSVAKPTPFLNILLVEDDPLIGFLLAEMLLRLGHAVVSLQTTEEGAIAAAAQYSPDLMIVDVSLAVGNGVAAVERITRIGPVPHLFMTGLGPLGAPPGAVVLTKPFREADLMRAIARAWPSQHPRATEQQRSQPPHPGDYSA